MQDVQIAAQDQAELDRTPLPLRGDTILGVCEAIGEDFGFHPNWLRVAFAAAIYVNPIAVIATYLALGLVVAVSRFLFPKAKASAPTPLEQRPTAEDANAEDRSLPLAA
jgi:phage shock protein PspC (stress-responsive transcriptional regulator)